MHPTSLMEEACRYSRLQPWMAPDRATASNDDPIHCDYDVSPAGMSVTQASSSVTVATQLQIESCAMCQHSVWIPIPRRGSTRSGNFTPYIRPLTGSSAVLKAAKRGYRFSYVRYVGTSVRLAVRYASQDGTRVQLPDNYSDAPLHPAPHQAKRGTWNTTTSLL